MASGRGRCGDASGVGREFLELTRQAGPHACAADVHLRYLRRINLAGLLQRLDTATMLERVEGRTPLADCRIAELAESLPIGRKFIPGSPAQTKRCLRSAFAADLSPWVIARPKASFPLPFQAWIEGTGDVLRESGFAAQVFAPGAVEAVAQQTGALWRLAWPMLNLALWGERWWGRGPTWTPALLFIVARLFVNGRRGRDRRAERPRWSEALGPCDRGV